MKFSYLNLKSQHFAAQTAKNNQLISSRNKDDFYLNKTLIPLSSSKNNIILFSYLLAKIFVISKEDNQKYLNNFHKINSFPKLLLDHNIIVEKSNITDKNQLKTPPNLFRQLMLNISPNCNLRCKYCYASSGRRPEHASMTFSLAKNAIDYVSQYCGNELNIGFVGEGEPTYEFELLKKIISYAKKTIKKVNVGPLSTNGVVSKKVADWLIENVDNLQISCDGPAFIQDKYRPLLGNKGSSVFVEKTISYLVNKGKDFQVRATITDDTIGKEKQIINYFLNLGVKKLLFAPLEKIGAYDEMIKNLDYQQNISSKEKDYYQKVIKIIELLDEIGIKKYHPTLSNIGNEVSCGISTKSIFVVDPYGYVSTCTGHTSPTDFEKYPFMKKFIFGKFNFNKNKFEIDLSKIDKLNKIIDNEKEINRCKSCSFTSICGTVCLYRIGISHGSISYPKPSCSESDKRLNSILFKYLSEKYLINKKPFLELKKKKLFYSLFHNEFQLHPQNQVETMKDNPYIYITDLNKLNFIVSKIIEYKKTKGDLTFFLLKFAFDKDNLHSNSGKKITSFFEKLKENNVYFRISRPIPKTVFGKNYNLICEKYGLPKQFKDCLELYVVNKNQVIFPNGKKGTQKFSEYENRENISTDFYEHLK